MPALLAALVTALILCLALPGTASAGSATKRDKGGVPGRVVERFDLTRKERRALDIARVQVTGREGFGVFVDVTFKGNIERALGRGHLRRAAVAMILEPKAGNRKAAVLVTQGPARAQRVLRRTRSDRVGVVRDGRHVRFFLAGDGFSGVRAVVVKALPRAPRPRRARASQEILSDPLAELWVDVDDLVADLFRLRVDLRDFNTAPLDCPDLEDLLDDLEDSYEELAILRANLLDDAAEMEDAIENALTVRQRRARRRDLALLRETVALVESVLELVDELATEVEAILEEECGEGPPPLGLVFAWRFFDPTEVFTDDARFTGDGGSISGVRVSVDRTIVNYLCPTQLPQGQLMNTWVECTGGTLAVGEQFRFHLRTSPNPSPGMGGQVWAIQGGTMKGPFNITGP